MTASLEISLIAELTGLGMSQSFIDKATDGTTPTAYTKNYRVLATTNTDEALDLGDIATVTCIIIRAITENLAIDLDFVSAFDTDLTLVAGGLPALIPNPAGLVKVRNSVDDKTPTYEFLVIGTT